MSSDLTTSDIHRQNVLNNRYAMQQIENELALGGIIYQNNRYFTKKQIAEILEVDERTIDRCVSSNSAELRHNGYLILKGSNLKIFKGLFKLDDTNVVESEFFGNAPQLGIFSFKSILNMAMLLTESEKAKEIRSRILDIAIDTIAKKSGGHTRYINQRDEDFLGSSYQKEKYRKLFGNAIDNFIEDFPRKYKFYTDKVYQSIFAENAEEYRKILNLSKQDNVRDTMYSEVIDLIASYEAGLADSLEKAKTKKAALLTRKEANQLFDEFSNQVLFKPLIENARNKMASRDLCFRDALHEKLKHYIQNVPEADYERFLGEKSKALAARIEESLEVYKRLKDR